LQLTFLSPAALRRRGATLPARVQTTIRQHEDRAERLIGWIQLGVVLTFATLYFVSPKTFDARASFEPVPWAIGGYLLFTGLRLVLAYRISLPPWFLVLSIVTDMALLFGLIWSFHLQYQQPPSFYLKAPTLLYVFIFIALRALRFRAAYVFLAGVAAALGWLALVLYAVVVGPDSMMITRDYVMYLTSNSVLLGAEFDKIASILAFTGILGVALMRGRALLQRAVIEGLAKQDLSRFFDPDVAARITSTGHELAAGRGEARDAAILNLDIRGFTRLARDLPPDEVTRILAEYQAAAVPILQRHGGAIDKFLGDGIMATFGAALPSDSYAADALRALTAALEIADAWATRAAASGGPAVVVNGAVATGRVVFGAVGDENRLEYTVIGDAVNLAAKLEKHNKTLGTRGLVTAEAFTLACAQGYQPDGVLRHVGASRLDGIAQPLDLVMLA
jgi:adenylate cyclase